MARLTKSDMAYSEGESKGFSAGETMERVRICDLIDQMMAETPTSPEKRIVLKGVIARIYGSK